MKWPALFGAANRALMFRSLVALWWLVRDSRTPRAPKLVAILVLAYALSPIDLIPDFIPVLGLLDDLVLVPLGVMLAVKLMPPGLWREMLQKAEGFQGRLPKMLGGLLLVLLIWATVLGALVWWFWRELANA